MINNKEIGIDYQLLNLLRITPWAHIEEDIEAKVDLINVLSKNHEKVLFHFEILGKEHASTLLDQTTNIANINKYFFSERLSLSPGLVVPIVNFSRLTPEFSAAFNLGILEYLDSQIIGSRYISSDDLKLSIENSAALWLAEIELTEYTSNFIQLSITRPSVSGIKFVITSKEFSYDGEVFVNRDMNKISIKHSRPPFMTPELDDIFANKLRSELEAINNSEDRLRAFTKAIEFNQANKDPELTPKKNEYSFLADVLLLLFSGLAIWGISFLIPVTYASILVIVVATFVRFF